MANRINDWRALLAEANKQLAAHGYEIKAHKNQYEEYSIIIAHGGVIKELYAEGYYENELNDLINDAWANVLAEVRETHNVAKLAEAYLDLTDAEKDEFLRLTGNQ